MCESDGEELATREKLWILNQRLRQVRFEQLTNYYKTWVLAMEALALGAGVVWIAALAIPPYSVATAVDLTHSVTSGLVAVGIAITILLRVVWILVTGSFPSVGRIEDWEI